MTSQRTPPWLEDFQARFGAVLRAPLDRSTGTLRATPSVYDPLVGARDAHNAQANERLAVYNRQYWFRLFGVLQVAFPLTTRLLGHWLFNDYAARFLLANPPRGWDVDHAADGFETWLGDALPRPERDAVREAAIIDAAWRAIFQAPPVVPFRPSADDAARVLDMRLVPSPAVALLEEHWPLLELRQSLLGDAGEAPVPLPPALPSSRWWALVRRAEGIARLPLEAREVELFMLLRVHPVRDALGRLEDACSPEERVELPAKARSWLARSVQLDFWADRS